jgi:adenylate cyclase class 2
MPYEEIEVKFLLDDLPTIRQRVLATGATLKTPRMYEDNVLLDTPDHRLMQQECLLRLRRDQRCLLTYKGPQADNEHEFKVRPEYEIEISDLGQAQALLAHIGFVPSWRYEKYRETFAYQEAEIVLDEVPVGNFLEIEGPRECIRTIAEMLGLDFSTRVLASYRDIFKAVCATYHLTLRDMTFENFQTMSIDLRRCSLS